MLLWPPHSSTSPTATSGSAAVAAPSEARSVVVAMAGSVGSVQSQSPDAVAVTLPSTATPPTATVTAMTAAARTKFWDSQGLLFITAKEKIQKPCG